MCWMCDHPGATQQDYFDELRSRVQKHGWAVQYVEIDRAPYAYTIGLHDRGLPELLVTAHDGDRPVNPEQYQAELPIMAKHSNSHRREF